MHIEIEYLAPHMIKAPIFGVSISNDKQKGILDINTETTEQKLPSLKGKGRITIHFERLDLNNGQYYVDVGVYEQNWAYAYDYHWHVYTFFVHSEKKHKGTISPPYRWEFEG